MLLLYDYFRSSAAFRVRIALNYKGISYEKYNIDLKNNQQQSDFYLKLNPQGLVPTLIEEADDSNSQQSKMLVQSLAIIEYLEETYPNSPKLLPEDLVARAYVRAIAQSIACDIHPLNNLRVLNYLTDTLKHSDNEKNTWYHHWIHTGLSSLEQLIKQYGYYNNHYCYSKQFTLADVCLVPQLFNARRFNCDLTRYPLLCAIEEKCLALNSVKMATP